MVKVVPSAAITFYTYEATRQVLIKTKLTLTLTLSVTPTPTPTPTPNLTLTLTLTRQVLIQSKLDTRVALTLPRTLTAASP